MLPSLRALRCPCAASTGVNFASDAFEACFLCNGPLRLEVEDPATFEPIFDTRLIKIVERRQVQDEDPYTDAEDPLVAKRVIRNSDQMLRQWVADVATIDGTMYHRRCLVTFYKRIKAEVAADLREYEQRRSTHPNDPLVRRRLSDDYFNRTPNAGATDRVEPGTNFPIWAAAPTQADKRDLLRDMNSESELRDGSAAYLANGTRLPDGRPDKPPYDFARLSAGERQRYIQALKAVRDWHATQEELKQKHLAEGRDMSNDALQEALAARNEASKKSSEALKEQSRLTRVLREAEERNGESQKVIDGLKASIAELQEQRQRQAKQLEAANAKATAQAKKERQLAAELTKLKETTPSKKAERRIADLEKELSDMRLERSKAPEPAPAPEPEPEPEPEPASEPEPAPESAPGPSEEAEPKLSEKAKGKRPMQKPASPPPEDSAVQKPASPPPEDSEMLKSLKSLKSIVGPIVEEERKRRAKEETKRDDKPPVQNTPEQAQLEDEAKKAQKREAIALKLLMTAITQKGSEATVGPAQMQYHKLRDDAYEARWKWRTAIMPEPETVDLYAAAQQGLEWVKEVIIKAYEDPDSTDKEAMIILGGFQLSERLKSITDQGRYAEALYTIYKTHDFYKSQKLEVYLREMTFTEWAVKYVRKALLGIALDSTDACKVADFFFARGAILHHFNVQTGLLKGDRKSSEEARKKKFLNPWLKLEEVLTTRLRIEEYEFYQNGALFDPRTVPKNKVVNAIDETLHLYTRLQKALDLAQLALAGAMKEEYLRTLPTKTLSIFNNLAIIAKDLQRAVSMMDGALEPRILDLYLYAAPPSRNDETNATKQWYDLFNSYYRMYTKDTNEVIRQEERERIAREER